MTVFEGNHAMGKEGGRERGSTRGEKWECTGKRRKTMGALLREERKVIEKKRRGEEKKEGEDRARPWHCVWLSWRVRRVNRATQKKKRTTSSWIE